MMPECAGLGGRTVEWRGIRLRPDRHGKILPEAVSNTRG